MKELLTSHTHLIHIKFTSQVTLLLYKKQQNHSKTKRFPDTDMVPLQHFVTLFDCKNWPNSLDDADSRWDSEELKNLASHYPNFCYSFEEKFFLAASHQPVF